MEICLCAVLYILAAAASLDLGHLGAESYLSVGGRCGLPLGMCASCSLKNHSLAFSASHYLLSIFSSFMSLLFLFIFVSPLFSFLLNESLRYAQLRGDVSTGSLVSV